MNNAGVPNFKPTEEMSLKEWQEIVDLNFTAVFLCSREALKVMKAQGGGRIVNMGSISAWSPRPHVGERGGSYHRERERARPNTTTAR